MPRFLDRLWNAAKALSGTTGAQAVVPGGYGDTPSYDLWDSQRQPDIVRLLQQYKADVYACANLNAHVFASQKLRLYVTTSAGQQKTARWQTRSLTRRQTKALKDAYSSFATVAGASDIEEIVGHPAMTVLNKPNPFMDMFTLFELTDLYCETVGIAYWYKDRAADSVIDQIWIVPPTAITPVRNRFGYVDYYSMGISQVRVEVEDIVMFAFPSLTQPYSNGKSPEQAVWNTVSTEDKRDAYNAAVMDNKAVPAMLLTPKETIGPAEARRLELKWARKFRRGGNAGVVVSESALDIKNLVQTNKDLEMYQMSLAAKREIANAFGVPISLLETTDVNRANADAGHYQHARMAIKPRCLRFCARLNLFFASEFDDRLFFAFDDPCPSDVAADMDKRTKDLASGVATINEERAEDGKDPVDWGDRPWLPFTVTQPDAGGNTRSEAAEQTAGSGDTSDEGKDNSDGEDGKDAAKSLRIFDALTEYWNAVSSADDSRHETAQKALIKLLDYGMSLSDVRKAIEPSFQKAVDAALHKERPPKGVSLPKGEKIASIMRSTFRQQRAEVLGRIRKCVAADLAVRKNTPLPGSDWSNLSSWTSKMTEDANPVVGFYWNEGAQRLIAKLNIQGDFWNISNPDVRDAIKRSTMKFCNETNQTTTMNLDDALEKLKKDLADGIVGPENTIPELTKRVSEVFDNAEKWRAQRIAITESSRALHAGETDAAKRSGLRIKMKWLLSMDACPVCEDLALQNDKGVNPGEAFGQVNDGPYGVVNYPPAHPNCQCSLLEVVEGENDKED